MATNTEITLAGILNIHDISPRIESFIWLYAAQTIPQLKEVNPAHKNLQRVLAYRINFDLHLQILISNSIEYSIFSEEYMEWICESRRQNKWILNLIEGIIEITNYENINFLNNPLTIIPINNTAGKHFLNIPTCLTGRNCSTAVIDYYGSKLNFDLDTKISIVMWIKNRWILHTESDVYFKWLSTEYEEEKREYFRNWLLRKYSFPYPIPPAFNSHDDLLSHFDNPFFSNDTKKLINIEAQKAWNQKTRREKQTNKQQLNVVLATSSIKKLDKLCKKYNISRTEFIEIIIDSESKHETHIKNRLARKNLLQVPEEHPLTGL